MTLQFGCHCLAAMCWQCAATRLPWAAMCTQMCRPLAAMCTQGCSTCRRTTQQRNFCSIRSLTATCRPLAAWGCCPNGAHLQITTSACVKQNRPHFGSLPVCQTTNTSHHPVCRRWFRTPLQGQLPQLLCGSNVTHRQANLGNTHGEAAAGGGSLWSIPAEAATHMEGVSGPREAIACHGEEITIHALEEVA